MDCIEWQGCLTNGGYGQFSRNGQHWHAHRWAWTEANGPIPPGMIVMHTCDNRRCVNPDHLRLGTQHDNAMDMVAKGRSHQSRKTHCPQGHEYTEENTYRPGRGTERQCRTCQKASWARVNERRKEERARRKIHQEG